MYNASCCGQHKDEWGFMQNNYHMIQSTILIYLHGLCILCANSTWEVKL